MIESAISVLCGSHGISTTPLSDLPPSIRQSVHRTRETAPKRRSNDNFAERVESPMVSTELAFERPVPALNVTTVVAVTASTR